MKTLAALVAVLLLAGCAGKEDGKAEQEQEKARTRSVKTVTPVKRNFEERLNAQGSLEAKFYAEVSPKIDGNLEEVRVDEGDQVVKDKTVLFVSDTRKPLQNKQVAEQVYLVAVENHKVALASVDKTAAQCEKARKDKDRYETLFKSGNVTVNETETYSTNYLVAAAALKLAQAQAQAAEAQMKQAKVSLQIATKDLEDCTIYAPISGTVIKRYKEPGERASKSTPVFRIEDTNVLEASALIPGRYFPDIIPGKTQIKLVTEKRDAGAHPVTFRADTVDTLLRTFEIKSLLKNDKRTMASGMMANFTIVLNARKGLAVPSHAVIQRQNGNVIFVNENGIAKEVIVTTGYVNDGLTEILKAETISNNQKAPYTLDEKTQVVYEGQYLVVNGDSLDVQK